jgi:PhzF family phenazine biosynthesis protein
MLIAVSFHFVDVFADTPLAGNPVALVPDADRLTDQQMRAIAREFNQSETTFIVRPSQEGATWQLRSFTAAGHEVFGAGHNAMGAWIWLAEFGRLPDGEEHFIQEIGKDLLPVTVESVEGRTVVSMDQSLPVFGAVVTDRAELASSLGLHESDLDNSLVPQVISTGAGHLLVPVLDRAAVDRVSPDSARLLKLLAEIQAEGCYVFSRDPVDAAGGSVAYARFFNPTVGIAEDPATGTAAGPLVISLAAVGLVADGSTVFVEQGYALGRPSRLRVSLHGLQVRISGSGIVVADGDLILEVAG